ncbi:glycoside hydrolase [Paenibacillus zeisoli]|uniref:Glycoside hydrolase n=1 Tax=Paenibacillus zeisoli TaxID=2496267 RepID=A0A3S1B8L3_9BACL|nr:beta-galactosidase [Paenibacillus zeisoli]RUT31782.1 glycoside hydrolase [Paenibacillus zeisoli]
MSRCVLVFYDPDFPGAIQPGQLDVSGSTSPSELESQGVLEDLADVGQVVRADQLEGALQTFEGGCLINLHAPYFPKSAWPEIIRYLRKGGGLISVGGAPFKHPVRQEAGEWIIEPEQTAYHQELYIHEALKVDGARIHSLTALDTVPLLAGQEVLFAPRTDTWNLVPHTTKSSDLPHQMGSSGPMSTRIYPLMKGLTIDDRESAAPVVLWENTLGEFAGSRWLFAGMPLTAGFWRGGGGSALAKWAAFCAKGVTDMWIKPNYASYEPGERAGLTLQLQAIRSKREIMGEEERVRLSSGVDGCGDSEPVIWKFNLTAEHENDPGLSWTHQLELTAEDELKIVKLPVPLEIRGGLYHVECHAEASDGEVRILRQGFWGHDLELLAAGEPVTSGRDYFVKDGRPMPVVGMTYMTSDVARKFLFLPNPELWDRDMAQMRKAGINWIRTGIWTAYRNIMQVDGHVSEDVLRAIDAFIMTAKKHDLQVTFTFFSFTPETWEGVNPYLDPQSVEAQKRFIRSIVSRHKNTTNVDWDLINEPSMFDPVRIFSDGPSSCHDRFEQMAFIKWLEQRHESIEVLQARWNMTPEQLPSFAAARIPESSEINFNVQDMHKAKKGTRWLDYCLFSMDMHNRWAGQLYSTIKELCPGHMVTVGQDEGLGAQRPSPFFYEEVVDYTTVHSWWFNDYLLWDGIFAKTPNKPNLIQETGVMYVETPDGRAKRSEQELRSLLERKYAYAFSTAGAGAVHWIWNTNFYMDNANESHIGALRADGTEKPEADVSYDFGQFIEGVRDIFGERQLEEIAAVFPYSNDFSNRQLAFEATTRLTRILAYDLKLPFRGASEYHLDDLQDNPAKLILLPSAHNFDDAAMDQLIDIVSETGAVLLVTGPIGLDAYWRPSDRLASVLGPHELRNVLREEALVLQGQALPVSFGHRRIAEVAKEVPVHGSAEGGSSGASSVVNMAMGRGRLIWSPLPAELSERSSTTAALYRYAAEAAGVRSDLEWLRGGELPGVYGRKLSFAEGSLFVFVSEYALDTNIEVRDPSSGCTYAFLLEQERSVLFAADKSGVLLGTYRPHEVEVTVTREA